MNTKIIKGTVKTGLGMAIKKWASVTGNRKLYVEGLATEYVGRGTRQYGRALDTRDDLMSAAGKQLKKTNKALMKQVKAAKKSDAGKRITKFLNEGAEKLNVPTPVFATAAVVGLLLLID